MKRKLTRGSTGIVVPVLLQNTSATDGSGLTGVTYDSSGLTARWKRSDQTDWQSLTLVAGVVGTWVASATTAGFVPLPSGRGACELSLPNEALAAGTWVIVQLYGAANMADINLEIELDAVGYQDATRFGLAALPTAAAGASNGLPLGDEAGRVTVNDKTGYTLSSAGVQAIWDFATSGIALAGSVGKWLLDKWGGLTPGSIRDTIWGNSSGIRNLTVPGGTTDNPPSGTDIVIRQGDLWTHSITGLGPIPPEAKVYFTIRRLSAEGTDDSDALAHIERTAGLLVLNGASATATPGRGTVAVTDADAGNLTITLQPAATKVLPVANRPSSIIAYGVKVVRNADVDANTLLAGTARIAPAVTRATS